MQHLSTASSREQNWLCSLVGKDNITLSLAIQSMANQWWASVNLCKWKKTVSLVHYPEKYYEQQFEKMEQAATSLYLTTSNTELSENSEIAAKQFKLVVQVVVP